MTRQTAHGPQSQDMIGQASCDLHGSTLAGCSQFVEPSQRVGKQITLVDSEEGGSSAFCS